MDSNMTFIKVSVYSIILTEIKSLITGFVNVFRTDMSFCDKNIYRSP